MKAFHDFGVTCSYDELLRFKKSVASSENADMDLAGLVKDINELVQGVGDNFDQEMMANSRLTPWPYFLLKSTQRQIETVKH